MKNCQNSLLYMPFPGKHPRFFFLIGSFTKDSLTYGVRAKVIAYKRVSEEH